MNRILRTDGSLIAESETMTVLQLAEANKANLDGADLYEANLDGANIRGANIRGADLYGANIRGATGIVSFSCPGEARRIGYAVAHDDGPMIQLGCRGATVAEAEEAIREKYGGDPAILDAYLGIVRAACAVLATHKITVEDDGA